MYLRHSTVKKDGKDHTYWRLVRSVRFGSRVVQQTVAQLGELDAQGRASANLLARSMTGVDGEQRDLFEAPPSAAKPVAVKLNEVRLERGRAFGDVWLGWTLWRALGLDAECERLLATGREAVPWSAMAAILVIARLCEPSSELNIAEDWYRKTALEDILGVAPSKVNDDRLYRALDVLLPHKEAIEQHLKRRLGELFNLDYDLLLYDVAQHLFRRPGAGPRAGEERAQSRPSPRLQAGLHRAGGDQGGNPARLRDLRRQSRRRHHGRGDRLDDGAAVRPLEPRLGDGPRHDERGQPRLVLADEPAVPGWNTEGRAEEMGTADSRREGLARSARGPGGEALRRARWP
jgi:hypothetical protein